MNILGIDPGKGGGLCFRHSKGNWIVNMPETTEKMYGFANDMKRDYGNYVVFIEKVQMWLSDQDSENQGKAFRVAKMLANYEQLLTVLKIVGVPIIEVYPRTWQKTLVEKYGCKPKTFTNPKNAWKLFAVEKYNNPKITLKTGDACCIAFWGHHKSINQPSWVIDNVINKETKTLFRNDRG